MAMFEFYRSNLKYFIKLFYYKYKLPFLIFIIIPLLLLLVAVFVPKLDPYQTDLTFIFGMIFVAAIVLTLLGFLWRVIYLTGYSLIKGTDDFFKEEGEEMERVGGAYKVLIIKFSILWILGVIGIFLLRHRGIL